MRRDTRRRQPAAPSASQPQIPENIRRLKLFGDDSEHCEFIRIDLAQFALEPKETHDIYRKAMTLIGFPKTCPRASCRRAARCTTPLSVCQFERIDEFEPYSALFFENGEKYGDYFHGFAPLSG